MAAGRLHESQGRPARAAEQYRQVVASHPAHVEAYNRLGVVLDRLGRFKEADEAFHQAIRLAPQQAHLRNNLGFSYMMQSRWREAERELRAALDLQPHFARARVNLGMTLAQQDRYEEARAQFEQALPVEDAWYNMGLMYQLRGRMVESARAFQIALEINPRLVAAQKRLDMLPPDIVTAAHEFSFDSPPPGIPGADGVSPAEPVGAGNWFSGAGAPGIPVADPEIHNVTAEGYESVLAALPGIPGTQPAETGAAAPPDAGTDLATESEDAEGLAAPCTAYEVPGQAGTTEAASELQDQPATQPAAPQADDVEFPWEDPFRSPLLPFGHERRLGPVKPKWVPGDAAAVHRPVRIDPRQPVIFLWQAIATPMRPLFGPPPGEAYGAISMASPLPLAPATPFPAEPLAPPDSAFAP